MRLWLSVAFGICLAASGAVADEPFYKGKRLTLLIGSAVGGPTDIEGRLFAKYLARHVEGRPALLVQNRDGAAAHQATLLQLDATEQDLTTVISTGIDLH